MKAVILAAGNGTRLYPATQAYNKHLVLLYNKPLIFYPLSLAIRSGASKIGLLTNKKDVPLFKTILSDGTQWNIQISYIVQESGKGIGSALQSCENFIGDDRVIVILGDNVFLDKDFSNIIIKSLSSCPNSIFLAKVDDPTDYGIAEIFNNRIVNLVEKPQNPTSDWAITGVYVYDGAIIGRIRSLKPSKRGEIEITDFNRLLLSESKLSYNCITSTNDWFDAGKPSSLLAAAKRIEDLEAINKEPIGCPYFSAWSVGRLSIDEITKNDSSMLNTEYGRLILQSIKQY